MGGKRKLLFFSIGGCHDNFWITRVVVVWQNLILWVGGWLDENRILLSGRHYFCCNKVNLNLYQPNPTLPNHALPHPTLPSATVLAGLHW